MRAIVQRVQKADVVVNDKIIGKINNGLLVFLAIHSNDAEKQIKKMGDKIVNLRIFDDQRGKMNLSLKDINGEMLVVSQFTLYGDCKKGNRPNFSESAKLEKARVFYEKFIEYVKSSDIKIETGSFGGAMRVGLVNDGPVTLVIDN